MYMVINNLARPFLAQLSPRHQLLAAAGQLAETACLYSLSAAGHVPLGELLAFGAAGVGLAAWRDWQCRRQWLRLQGVLTGRGAVAARQG
jgi:hypothetical protein